MAQEESYLKLLQKLSIYDELLEQLQVSFSDGFSHLSRANYHNKDSLRGRYGKDYWDEKFAGTQFIKVHGSRFSKNLKGPTEEEEEEEEKEKDLKTSVRNRKVKDCTTQKEENQNRNNKKQTDDPIYMFGGALSIPFALRQCQTSFKGSLPLILELINCRREIEELSNQLERESLNECST